MGRKKRQKTKAIAGRPSTPYIPVHGLIVPSQYIDRASYNLGMADKEAIIRKTFLETIDLYKHYEKRLDSVKQVIARIDEVAQSRKGMKPNVLRGRLGILRRALASDSADYKTASLIFSKHLPEMRTEMNNWISTVSTIQDRIDDVIEEKDDGRELAKVYGGLPANKDFAEIIDDLLKRERSLTEGKEAVGRRAYELRIANPELYTGRNSGQRVTDQILKELEAKETENLKIADEKSKEKSKVVGRPTIVEPIPVPGLMWLRESSGKDQRDAVAKARIAYEGRLK